MIIGIGKYDDSSTGPHKSSRAMDKQSAAHIWRWEHERSEELSKVISGWTLWGRPTGLVSSKKKDNSLIL